MNRTAWSATLLGAQIILLAGCGSTDLTPYQVAAENSVSIKQALQSSTDKVALGVIRVAPGVDDTPLCRLVVSVEAAPGKSLSQYVQDAFKQELLAAQIYAPNAPTVIDGRIETLTFSSMTPANWQISLRVKSNRSAGYAVSTTFPFETSYFGDAACRQVGNAFRPAVQALMRQVVSDPRFGALVVPSVATINDTQSTATPPRVRRIDPATGLSDEAALAYSDWRGKPNPRAFVICAEGHWESAWGAPRDHSEPTDPLPRALLHARQHGRTDCRPYAVDGRLADQE